MNFQDLFQKYWPFLALIAWYGYKWWSSQKVVAMLPELKKNGAILIDVRSAGEFASANAPGTIIYRCRNWRADLQRSPSLCRWLSAAPAAREVVWPSECLRSTATWMFTTSGLGASFWTELSGQAGCARQTSLPVIHETGGVQRITEVGGVC
jgi:hypothetical protein